MVFDQQLCLLVVAGPGARLWRYAERNVVARAVPARHRRRPPSWPSWSRSTGRRSSRPAHSSTHSADTGLDFHFAAVPIPNPDGEVDQLLVTVTDVTQVKADEEALREAERRFRTAFVEGPVGMARTARERPVRSRQLGVVRADRLHVRGAVCHHVHGDHPPRRCRVRGPGAASPWSTASSDTLSHREATGPRRRALRVGRSSTDGRARRRRSAALPPQPLPRHHRPQALRVAAAAPRRSRSAHRVGEPAQLRDGAQPTGRQHRPLRSRGRVARAWTSTTSSRSTTRSATTPVTSSSSSLAACRAPTACDTDVIGRLGGDEFAVMLPYATRERGRTRRRRPPRGGPRRRSTVLAGTHRRKVTTSIGIAIFDDPGVTGAEMLINADLAMYDAKEAGRDRYAVHQTIDIQPTTRARLAWVDRITHALDHDRFTLFAQPIMHLATRPDHPPRAAATDDQRRR